jgi:hypothetical protein
MGREKEPFQRRRYSQGGRRHRREDEYNVYDDELEAYEEDLEYEAEYDLYDDDEYEVGEGEDVYEQGSKLPRRRSGTPLPPSPSTTRNIYPRASRTKRMSESMTPRPPMRPTQGRGRGQTPPLQRQDDPPDELRPSSRRSAESQPLSRRPTGPQSSSRHPTGPQAYPRRSTESQPLSRHPTGPRPSSRRLTEPQLSSSQPTGPRQGSSRRTRRVGDLSPVPDSAELVPSKPRKRKVWPIFLIGCVAGAVSLVLAATIIVLMAIHSLRSDLNLPSGKDVPGKPEIQTIPLSTLSQLLVCDAAGDIALGVDPNPNATSASVKTTKIALNTTDQNDANQKVGQVVVSVEGQSSSPAQQPLTCQKASTNTAPTSNPTTAPSADNTVLSVNVSFPPDQAGKTVKVDVAILLPQSIVQAQASTNAFPSTLVSIRDDMGKINIDGGNIKGIMQIHESSGDITVRNWILVDGSRLEAGGKLTFDGLIWQAAAPSNVNKRATMFFSGASLIDLTLPEAAPVIIDATVNTRVGKIDSENSIQVVDEGNGSHTYYGPFNPKMPPADGTTAPKLTLQATNGNISMHKK